MLLICDVSGTILIDGTIPPAIERALLRISAHHTVAFVSRLSTTRLQELCDRYLFTQIRDLISVPIGSKKDAFQHLLLAHSTSSNEAIMISDSPEDISDAAALNIPTIAALYGFAPETALQAVHPLQVFYSPDDWDTFLPD